MDKKNKNIPKDQQPPKRNFQFYLGSRERYIKINCDFDSGNINIVRQMSQFSYRLESVLDGTRTDNKVNAKSWFYFSVQGFPKNTTGKFTVNKVQTLTSSKYNKSYRPVYKIQGEKWKRLQTQTQLILRQNGQLECVFQYLFKNESEKVYFAFCYPYTHESYTHYMSQLNEFLYRQDFYFYKQILIKSPENRDIHLITITSHDHKDKDNEFEQQFNEYLFPEKKRPIRFNKPVVLISARVHPGETSASYTMQGIINFLTNKKDLRANLLRKMFVFMLIPMINVDGVYHGHFRMDIYGKNLNRFYINPDPLKQPAIYAIKQLANHLTKDNRLSFYFDLHAHNAKKGCFIYGNAINDFVEQVQSQVFCKLFALNHKGFEYNYCNFTQKHMNAKDTNQDMTKQGCGRVVMYKLADILHSYSLECGIISANKVNIIPDPVNHEFKLDQKGFEFDELENNKNSIYTNVKGQEGPQFTEDMYRNLGKNLLVSILDVFDKNPYNRIYNSHYKSMDMLRRITAFEIFHNTQRFRMFQRFVFGKVKNINQLIKEVLNQKLHYKKLYNFYFFDDKELKNIIWPQNIPGFSKPTPKSSSPSKLRKFRSLYQPRKQYQYEFFQTLQQNKMKNQQQETNLMQSRALLKGKTEANQLSDDDNSSDAGGTEDVTKRQQQFNQQQFLSMQIEGQKQTLLNVDKSFSNAFINFKKKEVQFKSLKLQQISIDHHERAKSPQKLISAESPSVRVRRLLKQDNTMLSSKQSKRVAIDKPERVSQGNIMNKDSIIQSIKQDIKQQLKRQHQKKISQYKLKQNYLSHMGHFVQKDKMRVRSTSTRHQGKVSGSKIQLPSLGAHFFVISTSNKAITKKF